MNLKDYDFIISVYPHCKCGDANKVVTLNKSDFSEVAEADGTISYIGFISREITSQMEVNLYNIEVMTIDKSSGQRSIYPKMHALSIECSTIKLHNND
jgi:hypothetical protein